MDNLIKDYEVKPIAHRTFYSEKEKVDYQRQYVRDNSALTFEKPISIFDIVIDIQLISDNTHDKVYLHLLGTKGEHFVREFTLFRQHGNDVSFKYVPFAGDILDNIDAVLIEKIAFSCDVDSMIISFNTKELQDQEIKVS